MARLAALLAVLAASMAAAYVARAELVAGVAMSGSFAALSPLKVPQGSVVSSDSLFVVVFNQRDEPLHVRLEYDAPPGITVAFVPNTTDLDMPPHSSRRFRVVINVSDAVTPGRYTIYVRAYVVRNETPGKVVVLEGAAEKLELIVVGDYSVLHVRVVDPGGDIARSALVRVMRPVKGREVSVADSWGGVLDAKLIPGNYTVYAYMAGELVASARVALRPYEEKNITLEAKVLYIERFSVKPLKSGDSVVGAKLHVVIKNLYHTLHGVTVILEVARDGNIFEERPLVASSTLPPGRSEYFLDYVPEKGLEPGNYTFRVKVYAFNGKLVAASKTLWMQVPGSLPLLYILVAAAAATAAALWRLLGRRG